MEPSLGGPAHSFLPVVFYFGRNAFFHAQNLAKTGQTSIREEPTFSSRETSRRNADNFLGDLSIQGSSCHVESHSTWRDNLQFLILVDFWLFSEENSVGGDANKNNDDNFLLPSSAHSLTPNKGAATTPKRLAPRRLPCLRSPLLRLVGL